MRSICNTKVFLSALVCLPFLQGGAAAQMPTAGMPGKALLYRVTDSGNGEEIAQAKIWQTSEADRQISWIQSKFSDGDHALEQCVATRNASKWRAVLERSVVLNSSGMVVRSGFETFDPALYPFLHRPLPVAGLVPAQCWGADAVDADALRRGEDVSIYLWVNDAIYFRLVLRPVGAEQITVAGKTYDALKLRAWPDMTTIFPDLPSWAARLIGLFAAPTVTAWVSTDEDRIPLRFTGLSGESRRRADIELAAIVDAPGTPPPEAGLLRQAAEAPADPPLKTSNTGSFTVGDLAGRVVMSTAQADPGELLVVRTVFNDGLAVEGRSVVTSGSVPPARDIEQRTYAPDGKLMQRKVLNFRPDAFPEVDAVTLPDDLYADSLTLGLVLPNIREDGSGEAEFHVMGFDGNMNQLEMWRVGETSRAVNGGKRAAIHARLKPIIQLPFFLRPAAFFLIPTFDFYLDEGEAHRLLDFTGPFGPPGSPSAHFLADADLRLPRPVANR